MARKLIVYAVCYDIQDDKTRRQLSRKLLVFGDRVQYSVFEVGFRRQSELRKLAAECQNMLDEGDDIRFYRLCEDCIVASQVLSNKAIGQWPGAILVS